LTGSDDTVEEIEEGNVQRKQKGTCNNVNSEIIQGGDNVERHSKHVHANLKLQTGKSNTDPQRNHIKIQKTIKENRQQ
jgi:hypothetical protein